MSDLGVAYARGDTTAHVTPDALRVMLSQSGLRCTARPAAAGGGAAGGAVELVVQGNEAVVSLLVDSGYVTGIVVYDTFVDPAAMDRTDRVCELLETMGWVPED